MRRRIHSQGPLSKIVFPNNPNFLLISVSTNIDQCLSVGDQASMIIANLFNDFSHIFKLIANFKLYIYPQTTDNLISICSFFLSFYLGSASKCVYFALCYLNTNSKFNRQIASEIWKVFFFLLLVISNGTQTHMTMMISFVLGHTNGAINNFHWKTISICWHGTYFRLIFLLLAKSDCRAKYKRFVNLHHPNQHWKERVDRLFVGT